MKYGRYELVRELGRGAMGIVYLACDPKIDRKVAIKTLRKDSIASETFVKRFLKEARAIGRLSHPSIVSIYDVGEDHDTAYIAMEFLDGTPLSEIIKQRQLDLPELVGIGVQIAETLHYAHQQGIVHRDVKPSNIIVQKDGRIKLTDFGVAHFDDSSATMQTQTGTILGTPAYMSPEQVLAKPIDGRSDLFSLGIILYEMSTGKIPFGGRGKGIATVLNEIVVSVPQEPHVSANLIPRNISKIIMKALEKDPGKRYQSGSDLAEALQKSLVVGKDAGAGAGAGAGAWRNAVAYIIAGAAVTAMVIAGGISLYDRESSGRSPRDDGTTPRHFSFDSKSDQLTLSQRPSETTDGTGGKSDAGRLKKRPQDRLKDPKKERVEAGNKQPIPVPPPRLPDSKPVQVPPPEPVVPVKPASPRVRVYVKAEPIKSVITLGEYRVEAEKYPVSFFLPLGRHKLRIVHNNYEPYEEEIILDDIALKRPSIVIDRRLRPKLGQLD